MTRQAQHQRHREPGVHDDPAARDRVRLRQVGVEVVLVGVAGQEREPRRVSLGDGASEGVLVHRPDLEVLEEPSELGRDHGGGRLVAHGGILPLQVTGSGIGVTMGRDHRPECRDPGRRRERRRPTGGGAHRRRGCRAQRGARHLGQARRRPAVPRRAPGRGTPAHRGRARRGQDHAGQGARPQHRLHHAPHPVHPRPAARRRHRRERLRPAHQHVRVPARRRLREHRARRRDQPRLPQDPVRPPRGDGGAAGHGRRAHVPTAPAVHGHRHAEPGGDGGHLRAARGPARPLPDADQPRLPRPRRRDRHARLA